MAQEVYIKELSVFNAKRAIFSYGYYPALVVLKELQDKELYRECAILKEAMEIVFNMAKMNLGTLVSKKDIDMAKSRILMESKNPELVENNMEHYISEFKRTLNLD